jgi:hypothetical protein
VNIAILGTGNVGQALGASLGKAGHRVTLASRDAEKAQVAATAVGAGSSDYATAVATADAVILAIPFNAVEAVAAEIAPYATGKVIIDATNPIKADFTGLATEGGPSGGERLAALLPSARIVKAFNTLFAGVQGNPDTHGQKLDALYATDDDMAASALAAIATSIGFRPVRVGPLAAARELESLAWLNIRLQVLSNGAWQSSYVLVGAPEAATAG